MGARQFVAVVAVALCVSAAVGAVGVEGATSDAAQSRLQQVSPDTVVMDVEVFENGTAKWEIIYRTRLDDPDTADAFRSYQADVENNSTEYSEQFAGRMTNTVRSAERATGREMAGRDFGVRAETQAFPQRYGIVAYSFYWEGFAATDGDELRIGDAFSGLFLDEKTRLLVSWPEGYEVTELRPAPDERRDRAAVWVGPTDFAADQPRLVLSSPGTAPFDLPWRPLGVGLLAVALVGAGLGGWWVTRGRGDRDERSEDPPEDLLSNEERVLRLLERRGGRVKQKAVVDELGWTEAKTSQVVGSLREQGEIESFRLGRENVLALPREQQES